MQEQTTTTLQPGVCIPWDEKKAEYAAILGDEIIVQKAWEDMDQLAYLYVWFCLIQF